MVHFAHAKEGKYNVNYVFFFIFSKHLSMLKHIILYIVVVVVFLVFKSSVREKVSKDT